MAKLWECRVESRQSGANISQRWKLVKKQSLRRWDQVWGTSLTLQRLRFKSPTFLIFLANVWIIYQIKSRVSFEPTPCLKCSCRCQAFVRQLGIETRMAAAVTSGQTATGLVASSSGAGLHIESYWGKAAIKSNQSSIQTYSNTVFRFIYICFFFWFSRPYWYKLTTVSTLSTLD